MIFFIRKAIFLTKKLLLTNQYIPYSNKTKPVIKVYNISLLLRITKYYFLYLSRFIFRISPPLSSIIQHQPLCLPLPTFSFLFLLFYSIQQLPLYPPPSLFPFPSVLSYIVQHQSFYPPLLFFPFSFHPYVAAKTEYK